MMAADGVPGGDGRARSRPATRTPLAGACSPRSRRAEGAGGDVRGRQSSALVVVRREGRAVAALDSTCASRTTRTR